MPQARVKKSDTKPISAHVVRGLKEGALFIFITLMIYFLVILVSYHSEDPGWTNQVSDNNLISNAGGVVGAWFADVLLLLFGYLAYLVPVMIGYTGWLIYKGRNPDGTFDTHKFWMRCVGFLFTLINGTGLASLHFATMPGNLPDDSSGGVLGSLVSNFLIGGFGVLGATLFLLTLFLVGLSLFTGISWLTVMDHAGKYSLATVSFLRSKITLMQEYYAGRKARLEREEAVKVDKRKLETRKPPKIEPVIKELPSSDRLEMERQVSLFESAPDSELPALSLLDIAEHSDKGYSREALEAMSRLVEMKLQDFGIDVEVESVHPGPIITRFEIQPAAGVKVSQITNLSKDLARALSVISLRVVEVIPGKSVIGLEIPNEYREMIYLSEILRSQEYDVAVSPLTLALGKDISGHPIVVDLAKMPHLLVAGTTGSGKSVAVNAMILSLLYKATANDVRLIMIDPKMLELSVYEGIPHLLTPVVTDMKDAANALRWCVGEMERRYKLMASLGVRNMAGYNRKVKEAED